MASEASRSISLAAHDLDVRVPARQLVDGLSFEARPAEFVAMLGRNGTGKTLTLHTLAGLRKPDAGRVLLGGKALESLSRPHIARRLALLPQDSEDLFPASVLETALIGRHPHIRGLRWESARDVDLAVRSLAATGLAEYAARDVSTLSGGERRRLAIAQVLTQAPAVYLLDEPTNHLDPQHQLDALGLFRGLADQGATVIASLHDPNLAARYADRCLLLFGDGRWRLGASDAVLEETALSQLYATPIERVAWSAGRLFVAAGAPRTTRDGQAT